MSCFRKMCLKKKPNKNTSVENIIAKLKETESLLHKQQEELELQIEECTSKAKTNATTNKRMAMRALKKKKHLERNLEKVDQTLTSLELQRDAIESTKTNEAVLASMKMAGKLLKKSNTKLSLDHVHDLMDNINEQHGIGGEISTAIVRPLSGIEDCEDELLKELDSLINNDKKLDMGEPSGILSKLPSMPKDLDEVFAPSTEVEIHKPSEKKLANKAS